MKTFVPWLVLGIGLTLTTVIVILGWVVVPNIIEDKIEEEVRLVEGTETWNKWLNNPVPVYLKFTFFNITNPRAVLEGQKPILVEVGPYVYKELRNKTVNNIDHDRDTVSYNQNITYIFEPDMSEGHTEDDLVNIPNGAFMIVSTVLFSLLGPGPVGRSFVEALVDEGETFIKENARVGDAIFAGFPIPELYAGIFQFGGFDPPPPEFEAHRFGYYRGKNGTSDGEYTVRAGVTDSSKFGQIQVWDNKTELNWWYPPDWAVPERPAKTYCNRINGTDGSIFQPFIKKDTVLYTFISDVCRSTSFVYKEDIEHRDIPGYQFGFPDNFYDASDKNPDNICFCPTPPYNLSSECKGGAVRVYPCKSGGPIVTSSPHFLNAFSGYKDGVEGMNPVEDIHKTILQVEPNSGMMLKVVKRVQINLEFQPLDSFTYFDVIKDVFLFPVFWAEETVELDDYYAKDLKSKLLTPLNILEIGKWAGLGVGLLVVGIAGALLVVKVMRK